MAAPSKVEAEAGKDSTLPASSISSSESRRKVFKLLFCDSARILLIDRISILLSAWIRVGSDLPVGHPMKLHPSDLSWRNVIKVPGLMLATLLGRRRGGASGAGVLPSAEASSSSSFFPVTNYRLRILGAMMFLEIPSMCLLLYQAYYQHKRKVEGKERLVTAGDKWKNTGKSALRNLPYAFVESLLFKYFWSISWQAKNGVPHWRGFFQHTQQRVQEYGFKNYFFGGVIGNMMVKFWTRLLLATFLSIILPPLAKKILPKKITDKVPKVVQEVLNEIPIHALYFPLIQSTSRFLLGQHTSYESVAHVWFVRLVGDKLKDDFIPSDAVERRQQIGAPSLSHDYGFHRLYEGVFPHYLVTVTKIVVDELLLKGPLRKLFKVDKVYD